MICQATARTPDAAGRPIMQKIGCIIRRKITDGGELLDVLVTPEEWDGEGVQE
jgi:hypothetical protein